MKKSKYAVGVQNIRAMSEEELNNYIKYGAKAMNTKKRSFTKSLDNMERNFSEFLDTFKETAQIVYGDGNANISSSFKNKTREEKLKTAYMINKLANITETPKQVKNEVQFNIRDIFKEPRVTKYILEKLTDAQIIQIGKENIDFILTVLGSSRINQVALYHDVDSANFYKQLIQETSDELDKYDEDEKEEIIFKKWTYPDDEEEYNQSIGSDYYWNT